MDAAAATTASMRQLSQKEADIQMMLAADVHLGTKNCDFQMERYVFKRRSDGLSPTFFNIIFNFLGAYYVMLPCLNTLL